MNRQELISSANRRMRRARRTSGRLLASALGFGVAYYLDTDSGAMRRKQLWRRLNRTAQRFDSVLDSGAGDSPPVFSPLFHRASDRRSMPGALPSVR